MIARTRFSTQRARQFPVDPKIKAMTELKVAIQTKATETFAGKLIVLKITFQVFINV